VASLWASKAFDSHTQLMTTHNPLIYIYDDDDDDDGMSTSLVMTQCGGYVMTIQLLFDISYDTPVVEYENLNVVFFVAFPLVLSSGNSLILKII
jgi:hypothetical protein